MAEKFKEVIKAAKANQWEKQADGSVSVAGVRLDVGDFTLGLNPHPGVAAKGLASNDCVVVLDLNVTPELEQEKGIAEDLVRLVQQARKEAGLHIADHIRLSLALPLGIKGPIEKHIDYIKDQTLAVDVSINGKAEGAFQTTAKLAGEEFLLALSKVNA